MFDDAIFLVNSIDVVSIIKSVQTINKVATPLIVAVFRGENQQKQLKNRA